MIRLLAFFAAALLLCPGCISRRTGYAADEQTLVPGIAYREAVGRLGNPMAVRTFEGGTEAIWAGSATSGGGFNVSYWGTRLVRFGRTNTTVYGLRATFGPDGRLTGSWPVGPGNPHWGWFPFGNK